MKYIDAIYTFINKILMIIGGIAVLALMALATTNIILRILNMPYKGTYELVSFLGAVVIALALGFTQKSKSNIIVDILTDKFPKDLQAFIDKIADNVIMFFFALVAWQTYTYGMKIYDSNEVSETLKIAFYPFVIVVAIGFAFLSLTAFIDLLRKLMREEE